MAYLPKPGKSNPAPAGTWPAVCYRIIDLGTQRIESRQYGVSHKHQIMLSWELQDDECTIEIDGKVRRMTVHRTFTWTMDKKGNLRPLLESWRGKKFEPSEFGPGGFDPDKLVGAPCLIGLTHSTSDSGDVYANITSVSKLPRGMSVLPLENAEVRIWIDSKLRPSDLDKLSENMREKIKSSPEYKELFGGGEPAQTEPEWEGEQEMAGSDVPF